MRTILTWYSSGGPFVLPLAAIGLAGLVLLLERISTLVIRSRVYARPFIERVLTLVHEDKLDEALALCASHKAALPDLGLIILRSRSRDDAALTDVAEASMLTVLPALTRRTAWLDALARVALLVGILGGIVGASDVLSGNAAADSLARALATALPPLGIGVFTAIPLWVGHAAL